jgi:hypothetical protein
LTIQSRTVLREGLILGLIGAGAVAGWFLLVDVIAGRPFFTPAVLGSFLFFGLRDPAAVSIGVQSVLAYTAIHLFAFLVVGLVVAAILAEARKEPNVLWLFAEFFIVFEFGFYAAVALVFTPLLAELAWLNIAVGNLLAAGGMGFYVWRSRAVHEARAAGPNEAKLPRD